MTCGIPEAIAVLGERICSVHTHDNHGLRDEHLWPGEGTIDWNQTIAALKALAKPPALVLEIHNTLAETPASITEKAQAAFEQLA
jgi:sugar phosphate isomerase/epimerase